MRWEGGRWLVEDVEEDAGGEGPDGDRRDGNGDRGDGRSGGGDTDDGATVDSGEREERRRGVWECEADIMERAEARRGYTVAAAWDEGAMIQLMARMSNPTLAVRRWMSTVDCTPSFPTYPPFTLLRYRSRVLN